MSLGDLLFPRLFRRTRPRLRLTPSRLPFETVVANGSWTFHVERDELGLTPGDSIAAWQRFGTFQGCPTLSPVAAKVVTKRPLRQLPGSEAGWAITIEPDDEGEKATPLAALGDDASSQELRDRFDTLGVTTYGLDARPLADLLGDAPCAVLINAADTEPTLTSESQLLRDRKKDVAGALDVVSRAAGGAPATLVVSASLLELAKGAVGDHSVAALPERYPATLDELAAQRVLDGAAPVAALSLESALAASRAAHQGSPTFERHLTVVAADGKTRTNYRVPLGTTVIELLEKTGYSIESGDRIVSAGPLRGRPLDLELAVVTASTTAIMIIPEVDIARYENAPCISCGSCVDVCPMNLQVQSLGRNAEFGFFEKNRNLDLEACIACGLCGYVCPSGRPLPQWIELSRKELAALDAKSPGNNEA